MTSISIRITQQELDELDATAAALELDRSTVVRARLRWARAMEKLATNEDEPR